MEFTAQTEARTGPGCGPAGLVSPGDVTSRGNELTLTVNGRHLLNATTRAGGPVRISKLLFPKRDFQQYDLQVSAKTDVHFGG